MANLKLTKERLQKIRINYASILTRDELDAIDSAISRLDVPHKGKDISPATIKLTILMVCRVIKFALDRMSE